MYIYTDGQAGLEARLEAAEEQLVAARTDAAELERLLCDKVLQRVLAHTNPKPQTLNPTREVSGGSRVGGGGGAEKLVAPNPKP